MTHSLIEDSDFDDEDDENEENYRRLLKKPGSLPPCDPSILPASSFSDRCSLCSREEAENILTNSMRVSPGNFLVRPSAHLNHPYSLSVLTNEKQIYHFQIGYIANKYVLGPLQAIDLSKSKRFSTLSDFLQWFSKRPIQFQDDNQKDHSILLQLYPFYETTRF
ncbi:unnamed protein product [Adineta ricciae]|uniref:SH2 domain-containing protein n=1 Tax=Adineta ricciae TaxID=249248 RepID=A0A814KVJ2_ADIRI|nr:unnamed protein product [Adineta ricciae]CAF1061248.1 unnamed protein product [Adineta ricciae]